MISTVSKSTMRIATKGSSLLRMGHPTLKNHITMALFQNLSTLDQISTISFPSRCHSTLALEPPKEVGKVERTLKALDMALVRQIKAELMEVDANSDGRQVSFKDIQE
jgi:hypothetical protein